MRTRAGGRNRRNERKNSAVSALSRGIVAVTALSLALVAGAGQALADHVTPEPAGGNPKCSELNPDWLEIKADEAPFDGEYTNPDDPDSPVVGVEFDEETQTFSWKFDGATDAEGLDAVFVKGGELGGGNLYLYDPEAQEDTGLHAPLNLKGGFEVSHISFCYDHDVETEGDPDPDPDCDTDPTHDACNDPEGDPDPDPDPDPTCEEDPNRPECNLQDTPPDPDDPGGDDPQQPQGDTPDDDTPGGGGGTKVKGRSEVPVLPRTGGSILRLAAIGTALLALGLVLQATARKRVSN